MDEGSETEFAYMDSSMAPSGPYGVKHARELGRGSLGTIPHCA